MPKLSNVTPGAAGYFLLWLFLSLWTVHDLARLNMPDSHDSEHHLYRTITVSDIWLNGHIIPRWAPSLGGGLGYPVFIYNAWLPAVISGAFYHFGLLPTIATHATFFLFALLGAGGAYLLGREIGGSRAGLVFWAVYHFAPYQLVNIYVRYALNEYAAGAIAPWMFLGLVRVWKYGHRSDIILLTLSIIGLVLTHNIGTVIFLSLAFAAAVYLFITSEAGKRYRLIVHGIFALSSAAAITGFFWMPLLWMRNLVMLENAFTERFQYHNQLLYWWQPFLPTWGYGGSVAGPNDGMSFQLGIVPLLVLGLALIASFRLDNGLLRRHIRVLLVTVVALVFCTTIYSSFVWALFPPMRIIQLPWRLLLPAVFCIALIASLLARPGVVFIPHLEKVLTSLVILGIVLSLGYSHVGKTIDQPESLIRETMRRQYITSTGMDEYRPRTASDTSLTSGTRGPFADYHVQKIIGQQPKAPPSEKRLKMNVAVNTSAKGTMTIPVFYFPGWQVYQDGQQISSRPQEKGLLQCDVDAGHHTITAVYEPTRPQRYSAWFSVLSVIVVSGLLVLWPRWLRRDVELGNSLNVV